LCSLMCPCGSRTMNIIPSFKLTCVFISPPMCLPLFPIHSIHLSLLIQESK
jgi:hypothetical protein